MIPRSSACVPSNFALAGLMATLVTIGPAAFPGPVRAEPTVALRCFVLHRAFAPWPNWAFNADANTDLGQRWYAVRFRAG